MTPFVGIVGGMSWRASAEYYRLANEMIAAALGGTHSARVLLESLDFAEVLGPVLAGRPDETGALILDAALRLEEAGADVVLLAANTAHQWHERISARLGVPVPHVADAVHAAASASGFGTLGLLGTSGTLDSGVYEHGLPPGVRLVVPSPELQREVDTFIDVLTSRAPEPGEAARLNSAIQQLCDNGVDALVLACTDFTPLSQDLERQLPVLDSSRLHVALALGL